MNNDQTPHLSSEWNTNPKKLSEELGSFIKEFGSFTPEWFIEVKFHLLKDSGLTAETRDELCDVSIRGGFCRNCDLLYKAKECKLWYQLFNLVTWKSVRKAPPCIRLAFAKNSIRTVVNFLVAANLLDPPFYSVRAAPSCKSLRKWGYCNPNRYCRAMTTDNTLEYQKAKMKVKHDRVLE
ncbi:MAG: hypothetical protein ACOC38_05095 [Promethearchaeia archaeon]